MSKVNFCNEESEFLLKMEAWSVSFKNLCSADAVKLYLIFLVYMVGNHYVVLRSQIKHDLSCLICMGLYNPYKKRVFSNVFRATVYA